MPKKNRDETVTKWIKVTDRLPSKEEFGPYPQVQVILQCNYESSVPRKPWQSLQNAELRFLGKDPNRPIWCSIDKPHAHIENDAWFVTHWAKLAEFPEPI